MEIHIQLEEKLNIVNDASMTKRNIRLATKKYNIQPYLTNAWKKQMDDIMTGEGMSKKRSYLSSLNSTQPGLLIKNKN